MAVPSKAYKLSWEARAKDLEELNARLATQLFQANQMLDTLYTIVKNHEARIEALE